MSGEPSAGEPAADRPSREGGGRRRPCASGSRSRRAATRSPPTHPEEVLRVVELALPSAVHAGAARGAAGRARPGARHAAPARRPDAGARGARRAGRGARRRAAGDRRPAAPRRGDANRRGVRSRGRARARGAGPGRGATGTARASSPRAWSSARTSCARRPGESFTPAAKEVDLDGAEEAFRRAMELAERARRRRGPGRRAPASSASCSSAACARGSSNRSSWACTSRSRSAWRRARSWRTSCRSCRSRRVHGDVRAPAACARALRAARRPARRDVHDHRARLPELGGRHPSRHELGATHRGDPPAHVDG